MKRKLICICNECTLPICLGAIVMTLTEEVLSGIFWIVLSSGWVYFNSKRMRQLERVIAVNRDFWESASASIKQKDGAELIETMRDLCETALIDRKN